MFAVIAVFSGLYLAAAHDNKSAIQTLERAQKNLNKLATPECPTCTVANVGYEDPEWRSCFKAICPAGYGQYYAQLANAYTQASNNIDTELLKAFDRAVVASLRSSLVAIEEVKKALNADLTISDRGARRLLNVSRLSPLFSKIVVKDEAIDIDATKAALKSETPADTRAMLALGEYIVQSQKAESAGPLDDEYEFFVQRHSEPEIKVAVEKALRSLRADADKVEAEYGIPKAIFIRRAEHAAAVALTRQGFDEIKDTYSSVASVRKLLALNDLDRESENNTLKSNLAEGTEEKIDQRIHLLKKYIEGAPNGTDELGVRINQVKLACVSAIAQAKSFAPKTTQIEQFKKALPGLREQFVGSLTPHLSQESASKLKVAAFKWLPSVPPTYADQRAALLSDLKDDEEESTNALDDMKAAAKANAEFTVAIQTTASASEKFDPIDSIATVCERQAFEPIRDAAYINRDRFLVGSLSVTNPSFGNPTLKHEFAHMTSGLFQRNELSAQSKKWYEKVRSCLQDAKGDAVTTEEDWADFGLGLSENGQSHCVYLEDSESAFTLKEANDSHSTDLYRILQGRALHGELIPDSCGLALKQKNQSFKTDCRALANASK